VSSRATGDRQEVLLELAEGTIAGDLTIPPGAGGLVAFAHGSGSGRHSPRNRMVAEFLNRTGLATLLLDLLTPGEEAVDVHTAALRFDIGLLADRVVRAIDWLADDAETAGLPIGLFGASTGAAAALRAAAERPAVAAVVSRGGRADLAGDALGRVSAPTLLIVGGRDPQVLELNRQALARLPNAHLEVVPGAGHLFEEAGTLDEVARLSRLWLGRYLLDETAEPSVRLPPPR
jgi:putative phosphoribosyl transferase